MTAKATITSSVARAGRSRSRRTASASATAAVVCAAATAAVLLLCHAPARADALFWPRMGFSGGIGVGSSAFGGAFDDVWDHHFRAFDRLNAVNIKAHANAWQPLRAVNSVWDQLIAAQTKQWQCSQHCRARQRATLPYEAEVSERAVGADADGDVEIALRLPNVKPQSVAVQVVGGDTLSIRATRAPRTHAPNALDSDCDCAHATADADSDAAEEAIERTYRIGRFVATDRVTATVSTAPVSGSGSGSGDDFVTTVIVRVPKAVRPDTKRIALSAVEAPAPAAVDAPAAVKALPGATATDAKPKAPEAAPKVAPKVAPEEPVTRDQPHASDAEVKPAAAATEAAAAAAAAAAAIDEPVFGTTAMAAPAGAEPVRAASDAVDEVINL